MVGQAGGPRYRYHMGGTAPRKGKEVCPSPALPKSKILAIWLSFVALLGLTPDTGMWDSEVTHVLLQTTQFKEHMNNAYNQPGQEDQRSSKR